VEELLQEQKVLIRGRLEANQHIVGALRDALLARDELVGREIAAVISAAGGAADLDETARVIDLRDQVASRPASVTLAD
jgi:hypothetical protein